MAQLARFEDYMTRPLIWLDADTLIREMSKGALSLDDFRQSFFGSIRQLRHRRLRISTTCQALTRSSL